MEPWSDSPVRERFRIKFYLDTNILAYLCDNTFSGLTQAIAFFSQSSFADLISSRFVIFEFVGIRKREHYMREVVKKSTNAAGKLNMSSLLKYRDGYDAPEVKFEDVQASIKQLVMKEVEEISTSFGIEYDKNFLHDSLLPLTFDISLSSKISRHDSLMMASAVWPDANKKDSFVFIISNDQAFVQQCSNQEVHNSFTTHNLSKPKVEWLRSMQLANIHRLNLTVATDDQHLATYLPAKLKELIVEKNSQFYLGRSIQCGNGPGFPTDVVCFELKENTPLANHLYLTIIGRDLDFVYSTKLPVNGFWNQVEIQNYPFQNNQPTNISFRPMVNTDTGPTAIDQAILNRLRETGNLIFINPDSEGLE